MQTNEPKKANRPSGGKRKNPDDEDEGPDIVEVPEFVPTTKSKSFEYRVAVFFDGTSNSATNTAAGPSIADVGYLTRSYSSDYTNVWRMYQHFKGYAPGSKGASKWDRVYLSGAGTTPMRYDDVVGTGLGVGKTGIYGKSQEAIFRILALINNFALRGDKIKLYVDVVGFSRGAATARYFMHRILPQGDNILAGLAARNYGIDITHVEVPVAALFDTVSSYGSDFEDDVEQLNLTAVRHVSEKAYHICAEDEFRVNFSLTNIKSAIDIGKGWEAYLPGAHADIGGGYPESVSEMTTTISYLGSSRPAARDADWLIRMGYFTRAEINTTRFLLPTVSGPRLVRWRNSCSRDPVYHHYTFIPLNMMMDKAQLHGLRFDRTTMRRRYRIGGRILPAVKRKIDAYVARVDADVRDNQAVWEVGGSGVDALPAQFRRRYCHYSASESDLGMETRWLDISRALRKRKIFDG
ncbi:MAG: DUF2235 domain-containing protein [Pseudomonadota bacterium]